MLLRRHVRNAWLWIAASVVSAMTFSTVLGSGDTSSLNALLLGASAQGAVTGLTLLWLSGMMGYLPPQKQHDVSRLTQDTYEAEYEYDDQYDYDEGYDDEDDDDYHSGRLVQG